MDIYVVVPVFNHEDYVTQAVYSVLKQPAEQIRVILVDDGSKDASGVICDRIAEKELRVTVIHQTNSGVSVARNAGIEYALKRCKDDDYIAFLDADDQWFPTAATKELLTSLEEQALDIYGFGMIRSDWEGKRFSHPFRYSEKTLQGGNDSIWELSSHLGAHFYRAGLIRRYGIRFLEGAKYSEDKYFKHQCAFLANGVKLLPVLLYIYRDNPLGAMARVAGIMPKDYYLPIIEGWLWSDRFLDEQSERSGRKTTSGAILANIYFLDMATEHCKRWYPVSKVREVIEQHRQYPAFRAMKQVEGERYYRAKEMLIHQPFLFQIKYGILGIKEIPRRILRKTGISLFLKRKLKYPLHELPIGHEGAKKKKVLFLIHNLGQGGAEKVLVNLVNNMDRSEFDISVTVLFGGGVNEQFLAPDIHFRAVFPRTFPGNSKLMKLFTPQQLHRLCVKEHYDIEVSYLEGPSARVISGCQSRDTKLVSWIHVEQHTMKKLAAAFRSEKEARCCYERFDQTVCVSQFVHDDFCGILDYQKPCRVLYNTVESDKILAQAGEDAPELADDGRMRLVAVGTLKESKGYMRLLSIVRRLRAEGYPVHLYILGAGPLRKEMEDYIQSNTLRDSVTLLGYDTNPYKYVAKCDLFICASFAEGFSTAATEALIVGTPVCTVEVSGMKEMLGEHDEWGVVTENSEDALYQGIKRLLDDPGLLTQYREKAAERGRVFQTNMTVQKVEDMLLERCESLK